MKERFLNWLSQAINRYLKLDPESHARLNKVEDKTITIELLPFYYVFQCHFKEHKIEIREGEVMPSEAKINGTPLGLCGALLTKEHRNQFFADDIKMMGDAVFAQQVIELFDELEIDWEEHISQFIRDVPAYHLGRFAQQVQGWLRHTETSFVQDVSDFIHEEVQLFPPNEALQDFYHEVDSLRMAIDRVEARIHYLRNELMGDEGSQ